MLVDRTNELANITAVIAHIAGSLGIPWFIEQPADRGDLTSDAYWDEIDDPPHMFNMPVFRNLRAVAQPQMITFPQCALDANAQKFTTRSTHTLQYLYYATYGSVSPRSRPPPPVSLNGSTCTVHAQGPRRYSTVLTR